MNNIANTVGYSRSTGIETVFRGYSTPNDPIYTEANKDIMFMAIFSHGGRDIWGDGGYISKGDLSVFADYISEGKISFNKDALIYLGACNAGTDYGTGSFAQELAEITGVSVIGMMNDGVAPTGDEGKADTMTYGPKMGEQNGGKFYKFQKGKAPELLGKEVDVIQLFDQQRQKEN